MMEIIAMGVDTARKLIINTGDACFFISRHAEKEITLWVDGIPVPDGKQIAEMYIKNGENSCVRYLNDIIEKYQGRGSSERGSYIKIRFWELLTSYGIDIDKKTSDHIYGTIYSDECGLQRI